MGSGLESPRFLPIEDYLNLPAEDGRRQARGRLRATAAVSPGPAWSA